MNPEIEACYPYALRDAAKRWLKGDWANCPETNYRRLPFTWELMWTWLGYDPPKYDPRWDLPWDDRSHVNKPFPCEDVLHIPIFDSACFKVRRIVRRRLKEPLEMIPKIFE